ncbi:MAG: hypothetical protein ACYTFZ_10100 [Planctomycetota bacterium]
MRDWPGALALVKPNARGRNTSGTVSEPGIPAVVVIVVLAGGMAERANT